MSSLFLICCKLFEFNFVIMMLSHEQSYTEINILQHIKVFCFQFHYVCFFCLLQRLAYDDSAYLDDYCFSLREFFVASEGKLISHIFLLSLIYSIWALALKYVWTIFDKKHLLLIIKFAIFVIWSEFLQIAW